MGWLLLLGGEQLGKLVWPSALRDTPADWTDFDALLARLQELATAQSGSALEASIVPLRSLCELDEVPCRRVG